MTRAELEFYSHNVPAIRNALERIANALEKNNKVSNELVDATTKDIPGFEGTLEALDNLTPTSDNPDPAGYGKAMQDIYDRFSSLHSTEDEYAYETDLQGIRVDSDHDIRTTAAYYEEAMASVRHRDLKTKKDCILDYVTNEFGLHGARYTDIIKFAYYLGEPNAPKYTSANRGYYSCAFNTKFSGHLIKGGKDFLVKGINNEGKERYFAHSSVDNFTGFYKRIA